MDRGNVIARPTPSAPSRHLGPPAQEARLLLILGLIVGGFFAAVVFHHALGSYVGLSYPYNTFLFAPEDFGRDFVNIQKAVNQDNPYAYAWSVYFPFTYVPLMALKSLSPALSLALMLACFTGAAVGFSYLNLDFLRDQVRAGCAIILSMMTYPVLFCLDRGNLEGLVFIFLAIFFVSYQRNRIVVAVLALSCASAMKLYPAVFALLFVADRRYKAVVGSAALTLALTLGAAASFPGGVAKSVLSLQAKLAEYRLHYIIEDRGLAFNSSGFGLLKEMVRAVGRNSTHTIERLMPCYTIGCLIAFAALAALVVFRDTVWWRRVAVLTVAVILFPHVSGDYKLIHLLFPMLFFLKWEGTSRYEVVYGAVFGLLLVPKAFFWLHGEVNVGVVVTPLLLSLLLLFIVAENVRRVPRASPMPAVELGRGVH